MPSDHAPTPQGRLSSEGLHEATKHEEEKVEAEKGSELKKGGERFDERARSSDGHSADEKQKSSDY
ncbi:MAG TPA: hypothetical protein VGN97_01450 [Mesorhizobium sp.]|jgi:hypothetical protein|nr:hypothetical protein [Mesorhizobium sp.]